MSNWEYDLSTGTWTETIGQCHYCQANLTKNVGLNRYWWENVRCPDNTIIKICRECADYMYNRGELIEIVIMENGSDYRYEVPTDRNTMEEKKLRRRFV